MSYQKLVRDRIPEIIEKSGEKPVIRTLDEEEYISCLEKKLCEEVAEYLEDKSLNELADILEVIYALCAVQGHSQDELSVVYQKKHKERGGFSKRIFLIGKE